MKYILTHGTRETINISMTFEGVAPLRDIVTCRIRDG